MTLAVQQYTGVDRNYNWCTANLTSRSATESSQCIHCEQYTQVQRFRDMN
uniref:Uncharacterized protein n=1 Tax=Anguilla anguilla TaxID=7936 RepID=A0A0E9RDF6_ANGAN